MPASTVFVGVLAVAVVLMSMSIHKVEEGLF